MTPLDFDKHIPWLTTEALETTRSMIDAELAKRADDSRVIETVDRRPIRTVGEGWIG